MTVDDRQLVQRLFALATMIAADAQEFAIRGQSSKLHFDGYIRSANDLRQAAAALVTITDAAIVALRQGRTADARAAKRYRSSR